MTLPTSVVVIAGLALGLAGGGAGQRGSRPVADFRLPGGDATKGQKTFLEFRCNACHRVAGLDLPAPVAQPPVPVVLGGAGQQARTDAELLIAIVHPSHDIIPPGSAGEPTFCTGSPRFSGSARTARTTAEPFAILLAPTQRGRRRS